MTPEASRIAAAFQRAADGAAWSDVAQAIAATERRLVASVPRGVRADAEMLLGGLRARAAAVMTASGALLADMPPELPARVLSRARRAWDAGRGAV